MSSASIPPDHPKFYDLAPQHLPFYRQLRYDGGGMGVRLDDFPVADRELLVQLYRAIERVLAVLRAHRDEPAVALPALTEIYERDGWQSMLARSRAIGVDLSPGPNLPLLRQVAHDLKGGAFQALAVHLQLIVLGMGEAAALHRIFFLARDHLKIMRNSLPGIDLAGEANDQEQRLHHVALLVEKWQSSAHRLQERSAVILVDSHYDGAIAERCLEFSALDRVLYNLLNNATAHSADGEVALSILPLPLPEPHDLRFVVSNTLRPEQAQALAERFPAGPGGLFAGGFTTGGSGLGLRICADFVCNAYGLANVEQGLAEGHFGATLRDDRFVAWVHWPIAAE